MTIVDADDDRQIASWLAETLVPLVRQMPTRPPTVVLRNVPTPAAASLLKAAGRVADAADRHEQVMFTPAERPALLALIRAARSLRTELRRRASKLQNKEPTI